MSIDPRATRVRISAGVDWAKDDHAVCVVGGEGEVLGRFAVRHDAAGLKSMVIQLLGASVEQAGIERPDGPVVTALAQAGLSVFVIPPGQVKNLRSRYGSAGNKDDRFDAYVLADVVRTDIRRLRPLVCDSPQTTALRPSVRALRPGSSQHHGWRHRPGGSSGRGPPTRPVTCSRTSANVPAVLSS